MRTYANRWLTLALALALVALVAVVVLLPREPTTAPSAPEVPAVSRALRLNPGDQRVYALTLRSTQTTAALGGEVHSELEADFDLQLEVREASAEERLVAVSVAHARRFRLVLLGAEVGGGSEAVRAQLEGHEALAAIDSRGALRRVRYQEGVPPLFQSLIQTALAGAQVVVGDGPRWEAEEDSPAARVAFTYRSEGMNGEVERLVKEATSLVTLRAYRGVAPASQGVNAQTRVELHRAGYVVHATGLSHLWARGGDGQRLLEEHTSLELRLVPGAVFFRPGALAGRGSQQALAPSEPSAPAATPRELLERRAAGLTNEQLVEGVRAWARIGPGPAHNEWLWRAVALLQLDSAQVPRLQALFAEPELAPDSRALVLDLLASAGHPGAQAALLALLSSEQGRALGPLGVARVGLVTRPTSETARWMSQHWDSARGEERLASAMVLGAVARNLTRGGSAAEASSVISQLGGALAGAQDSLEKQALLRALGNASVPSVLPAVLPFSMDADPAVRAACATALRNLQGPQTEAALQGLARDASATVQREAFRTLGGYRLEDRHVLALREAVVAGAVGAEVLEELLNLASAQARVPGVRPLLEAVLARPVPSTVRSRAQELLRTLR
jgi:hypothetical protein